MARRELRDDQWDRIEAILRGKKGDAGRTAEGSAIAQSHPSNLSEHKRTLMPGPRSRRCPYIGMSGKMTMRSPPIELTHNSSPRRSAVVASGIGVALNRQDRLVAVSVPGSTS